MVQVGVGVQANDLPQVFDQVEPRAVPGQQLGGAGGLGQLGGQLVLGQQGQGIHLLGTALAVFDKMSVAQRRSGVVACGSGGRHAAQKQSLRGGGGVLLSQPFGVVGGPGLVVQGVGQQLAQAGFFAACAQAPAQGFTVGVHHSQGNAAFHASHEGAGTDVQRAAAHDARDVVQRNAPLGQIFALNAQALRSVQIQALGAAVVQVKGHGVHGRGVQGVVLHGSVQSVWLGDLCGGGCVVGWAVQQV